MRPRLGNEHVVSARKHQNAVFIPADDESTRLLRRTGFLPLARSVPYIQRGRPSRVHKKVRTFRDGYIGHRKDAVHTVFTLTRLGVETCMIIIWRGVLGVVDGVGADCRQCKGCRSEHATIEVQERYFGPESGSTGRQWVLPVLPTDRPYTRN